MQGRPSSGVAWGDHFAPPWIPRVEQTTYKPNTPREFHGIPDFQEMQMDSGKYGPDCFRGIHCEPEIDNSCLKKEAQILLRM